MEVSKNKLDQLISAVDKIVESRENQHDDLFGNESGSDRIAKTLGISIHNPEKSYELYFGNIQRFLKEFLPKNNPISKPIRNLLCTLLSHHEMDHLTYGKRGGDSKMASTEDMEHVIDVLSSWSASPTNYIMLANILLMKNKELKYIPEDRTLQDYV